MSHLDEGTLHAMLDGELEPNEVAEIQAHVASCSSCELRLREVKVFLAEADRLIASVAIDGAATATPRREALVAAPEIAHPEPPRAEPRRTEPAEPEPVRPEPVRQEPVRQEPAPVAPVRPEPVVAAVPPRPAPPRVEAPRPEPPPPAPPPRPEARPRPRHVADRPSRPEPWNEPPPPLFIPDNESAADRRARRLRGLGWAAMAALFVGAGAVGLSLRPTPGPLLVPAAPGRADAKAVVSPEETARPGVPTLDSAPSALAAAPAPSKPTPAAKAPVRADTPANAAPAAEALDKSVVRAAELKAAPLPPDDSPPLDESRIDNLATSGAGKREADSSAAEDLATVRARASQALADLDRDRRREQASAATAALDAERRRRAAAPPIPAAAAGRVAPAPEPAAALTAEQRAQIYLRIGLDEASRQLGGPAHVIEGMSAMFMGLAQGVAVPGADATRPVVRVVYQDAQGRLIMLDQQRLRPGQPAPQGPLGWTLGETGVWLHGEVAPDALRTYRPRVR
jgi:Putative zinc-finger